MGVLTKSAHHHAKPAGDHHPAGFTQPPEDTMTCPSCDKPGGALTAKPHCTSPECSWNRCLCGATYSRNTGAGFANKPKPVHFPATTD